MLQNCMLKPSVENYTTENSGYAPGKYDNVVIRTVKIPHRLVCGLAHYTQRTPQQIPFTRAKALKTVKCSVINCEKLDVNFLLEEDWLTANM